jgi:hypothetical protein
MKVVILVDYDNLLLPQKAAGMLDVVTRVLMQLPKLPNAGRGTCEMRIYGGWYEGPTMTQLAQQLAVTLQSKFPTVVRLPTTSSEHTLVAVNVTLATSLLEDPGHHLINTFRKKGLPKNLRVQKPSDIGCTDPGCILPSVKKLLKSGSCHVATCGKVDLIYRNEQKIVDTMLTCDMIHASQQGFDHIVLVSADDDFIPPVRTLLLRGSSITRVHPKFSNQRQQITVAANRLVELEL